MEWLLFSHLNDTIWAYYSPKHGSKWEIVPVKAVWRHNQGIGDAIIAHSGRLDHTINLTIGKHSVSVCMNIGRLIAYYIDFIVERSSL